MDHILSIVERHLAELREERDARFREVTQ